MSLHAGLQKGLQDTAMAAAERARTGVKRARAMGKDCEPFLVHQHRAAGSAHERLAKRPYGMQQEHEKRTEDQRNLSHVQRSDFLGPGQVTGPDRDSQIHS